MYVRLHVKCLLLLPDFNQIGKCRQILETSQLRDFRKIRPRQSRCPLRPDGRTHMTKQVVAIRFVNAPKMDV